MRALFPAIQDDVAFILYDGFITVVFFFIHPASVYGDMALSSLLLQVSSVKSKTKFRGVSKAGC